MNHPIISMYSPCINRRYRHDLAYEDEHGDIVHKIIISSHRQLTDAQIGEAVPDDVEPDTISITTETIN